MRDRDREREREAETQAEGEAGSPQGTRCGTRSQVSRITPWAEGSSKPLSLLGCPVGLFQHLGLRLSIRMSAAQLSAAQRRPRVNRYRIPIPLTPETRDCAHSPDILKNPVLTIMSDGSRSYLPLHAFGSGHEPGVQGSSPTSGSLRGACFFLCLCLSLSCSLSLWVSHE